MKRISQLWVEEEKILFDLAKGLPEHSTIVEIGTAQGSSVKIMYDATRNKDIKIYSFDIFPSEQAKKLLKDTDVILKIGQSWDPSKKIDLLFIDGDHRLEGIMRDFNFWVSFLKLKTSIIAFHDYDPPERAGVSHFAAKVFLDTVLAEKILVNFEHKYRILYGNIEKPENIEIGLFQCKRTLRKILTNRDRLKRIGFPQGKNRLELCFSLEGELERSPEMDLLFDDKKDRGNFLKWREILSIISDVRKIDLFDEIALIQVKLFLLDNILSFLEENFLDFLKKRKL